MGKSQRTKGAVFEREVAKIFSDALGRDFKRNIGQARDGGNDIDVGPLVVEAKRRKTLTTIRKWYTQALVAATARWQRDGGSPASIFPVVVAREDHGAPLVILSLDDFLALARPMLLAALEAGE